MASVKLPLILFLSRLGSRGGTGEDRQRASKTRMSLESRACVEFWSASFRISMDKDPQGR